ncbi:hypothetical protein [Promicromonospora sukumoe]
MTPAVVDLYGPDGQRISERCSLGWHAAFIHGQPAPTPIRVIDPLFGRGWGWICNDCTTIQNREEAAA